MMAMTRSSKPSFQPASIDFGLRSRDYAEQRPGFPDSFMRGSSAFDR